MGGLCLLVRVRCGPVWFADLAKSLWCLAGCLLRVSFGAMIHDVGRLIAPTSWLTLGPAEGCQQHEHVLCCAVLGGTGRLECPLVHEF